MKTFKGLLNKSKFLLSSFKPPGLGGEKDSILLNECPPSMDPILNILITDVHEGDLEGEISKRLKREYLSVCAQSDEEIQNQKNYAGITYGEGSRMFVSIPTRFRKSMPFLYVHYLLDSGSPFTTLTHKALCALHGRQYSEKLFFNTASYTIGPCIIDIMPSDTNPQMKKQKTIFHSVNILGRNFAQRCKQIQTIEDIDNQKFQMIIQPKN